MRSRRPAPIASRLVAALTAVALALVLVGCGSDSESDRGRAGDPDAAATATGAPVASPADPSSSAAAPSSAPAAAAVPAALRFSATTVGGRAFDGASLAGRPVVLWFWAPWCTVCARQAPQVADLAEKYGDRVAFVGVGSRDEAAALRRFAGRVPGPVHLGDVDGELYRDFRISEQSSFVVLDATGREVLRTGYDDDARVAATVARLAG